MWLQLIKKRWKYLAAPAHLSIKPNRIRYQANMWLAGVVILVIPTIAIPLNSLIFNKYIFGLFAIPFQYYMGGMSFLPAVFYFKRLLAYRIVMSKLHDTIIATRYPFVWSRYSDARTIAVRKSDLELDFTESDSEQYVLLVKVYDVATKIYVTDDIDEVNAINRQIREALDLPRGAIRH